MLHTHLFAALENFIRWSSIFRFQVLLFRFRMLQCFRDRIFLAAKDCIGSSSHTNQTEGAVESDVAAAAAFGGLRCIPADVLRQ